MWLPTGANSTFVVQRKLEDMLNIINLCVQRWAVKEGIGACLIDKPDFVADVVRSKHQEPIEAQT